jgi:hypothetical protein
MQKNVLRVMLLAMVALMFGAATATAQTESPAPTEAPAATTTETEGRVIGRDDGSVLIGVSNDVALAAGDTTDAVLIIQGSALIEGTTEGVVAVDSDVIVQGPDASVEGIFTIGGSLTVIDGASVENIGYVDTDVSGVDAALISGDFSDIQNDVVTFATWAVAWVAVLLFFVWIGLFIATLASGLLVVSFGTSQVRRAAWTIGNDPLKVLAAGLIAAFLAVVLIALLAVSVVGLALAFLLGVMFTFVLFLGYLTVGLWIGERILRRSRNASRPYGAMFLGVLILILLSWIPFISAIAIWVGLGSVTLAGWRVLRGRGSGPVPPGYGSPYGQPYQVPPPPYAPPPYVAPPPPGQYPPQQQPQQPPQPPAGWAQ